MRSPSITGPWAVSDIQKAGVKADDWIRQVDGKSTEGMQVGQVVSLIRVRVEHAGRVQGDAAERQSGREHRGKSGEPACKVVRLGVRLRFGLLRRR